MLKLLKYELTYNYVRTSLVMLLPAGYLILILFNQHVPSENNFVARVLYPLIAGMLPVILIANSWGISLKESRIRLFSILPLKRNNIAAGRILFAVAQVLYLVLFVFVIVFNLVPAWNYISNKIVYQYGTMTLILSTLYFSYEFIFFHEIKKDTHRLPAGIIFVTVVIVILFITDNILWNKIEQSFIGIIYMCLGFFVLIIGSYLFIKRRNFLS